MVSMMRPLDILMDRWSSFDFKPKFTSIVSPAEPLQWIGAEDQRRLRAYSMLEAYVKNKARIWLGATTSTEHDDRREYGDAALIVKTALSSLLGDDWEIKTEGAQGEDAEVDQASATAQQKFIEQWADSEKFSLKMLEAEEQAIKFGDSVYALGWDPDKGRVRLRVYDPGFYFPVFDPRELQTDEFPNEVWVAWEFEEDNVAGHTETFVRRHEWYIDQTDDEDRDAPPTCFYRDAIWTLEAAVNENNPFGNEPYDVVTDWTDLEVDFIPVIHIPNTIAGQEHFGESVLADVLQILDDISSTDTDTQAAAATTGSPPIAVTGMGENTQESYGPGTILRTGDGTATLLDTSRSLDALLKLKDGLLERLAVNSRTPESLLGRVKPNEVPSGIALTLSFTPHSGMIKNMRLVRDYKYRILFSFVIRMTQANGEYPGGDVIHQTNVKFGSFLPADAQEAMTVVTQLLEAGAISLETAVQYLVNKGYPISDYVTEIERITERDYEGAQAVLSITGNPELAAERLGIAPGDVLSFNEEDEEEDGDIPTIDA